MKLSVLTTTGVSGTTTVSDALFGAPVNKTLLAQAIRVYLANRRQGTSKVKTRGEVNRTTRKVYRQKGTGNARHGSKKAPIFVGGGVAHGPTGMENWSLKLTAQLKKKAMISALSAQAAQSLIGDVMNDLDGKTKTAAQLLSKGVGANDRVLVVLDSLKPEVVRSLRNLQSVMVVSAARLNALEVAMANKLIFTSQAVAMLEDRLLSTKPAVVQATEIVVPKAPKAPAAKKAAAKPAKTAVAKKTTTTKKASK